LTTTWFWGGRASSNCRTFSRPLRLRPASKRKLRPTALRKVRGFFAPHCSLFYCNISVRRRAYSIGIGECLTFPHCRATHSRGLGGAIDFGSRRTCFPAFYHDATFADLLRQMAAAAPPSSVMNSRLLIIRSPGRHGRALAANFELQRLRCLKVDGWELRRLAGPMVSEFQISAREHRGKSYLNYWQKSQ